MNVSSALGELHFLSTAYGDRIMASDTLEELRGVAFHVDDSQQASSHVPTYRSAHVGLDSVLRDPGSWSIVYLNSRDIDTSWSIIRPLIAAAFLHSGQVGLCIAAGAHEVFKGGAEHAGKGINVQRCYLQEATCTQLALRQ